MERIFEAAVNDVPYVPASDDAELLNGILALLDEITDQAQDQYGIDCLLENDSETSG
jgi:hypothetical protein